MLRHGDGFLRLVWNGPAWTIGEDGRPASAAQPHAIDMEQCVAGHFGGCSSAELAQSSKCDAVSACLAFLSSASRSGPGLSSSACWRTPSAQVDNLSFRDWVCLNRRRFRMTQPQSYGSCPIGFVGITDLNMQKSGRRFPTRHNFSSEFIVELRSRPENYGLLKGANPKIQKGPVVYAGMERDSVVLHWAPHNGLVPHPAT